MEIKLFQAITFISYKNLRKVIREKSVDDVYHALLDCKKVSSMKCFKLIIKEYSSFISQRNCYREFTTNLVFHLLSNGNIKYAKYILRKYKDIDYNLLIRKFTLSNDNKNLRYISSRIKSGHSKLERSYSDIIFLVLVPLFVYLFVYVPIVALMQVN